MTNLPKGPEPFVPAKPIRFALVWTAIEQLIRRHHPGRDMRVYVTHPCDGLYFCVHLFRGKLEQEALCWNLEGTSFSASPAFGERRLAIKDAPWKERHFYEHCLERGIDSAVEALEALIGLPAFHRPHPPSKPHVLGIRLIAEVLRRRALVGEPLIAEPGFCDTSAQGGGGFAEWLMHFPTVQRHASSLSGPKAWASASRCWVLKAHRGDAPCVLLDLTNAEVVALGAHTERLDAWAAYQGNGRRLDPIADWVMARLRST